MDSHDQLKGCIISILGEEAWRTRMLPPLQIAELGEGEIAVIGEYARSPGLVGKLWGRISKAISMSRDSYTVEFTDAHRANMLAHFVAYLWTELSSSIDRGSVTDVSAERLFMFERTSHMQCWNESALQFGLTGEDFSDLIREARVRMVGSVP